MQKKISTTEAESEAEYVPSRRERLHEVIFEADTPLGKWFDVVLLVLILLSVLFVMLESVKTIDAEYHRVLRLAEWVITILFTIEYGLRLFCVRRPIVYARSFYGVIDLLSILPTYLSLFFFGAQSLLVIRALRLLRVFRVFKLVRYLTEAETLAHALLESLSKIVVFLSVVLIVVVIMGSLMYLVEGEASGFTSIPQSVYWAIVTITTVGYGDIAPHTVLGKVIACVMMIIGYAMIIVPTGILSAELIGRSRTSVTTQHCPSCGYSDHDVDAKFCKRCGTGLGIGKMPRRR